MKSWNLNYQSTFLILSWRLALNSRNSAKRTEQTALDVISQSVVHATHPVFAEFADQAIHAGNTPWASTTIPRQRPRDEPVSSIGSSPVVECRATVHAFDAGPKTVRCWVAHYRHERPVWSARPSFTPKAPTTADARPSQQVCGCLA